MNIKERLEIINEKIMNLDINEILSLFSEVKGLYHAYELSKNDVILESVIDKLLDVIEIFSSNQSLNTLKATRNKENKEGQLSGFYNFLMKEGKKPTTSDNYRKAIRQAMIKLGYKEIDELNNNIEYAIKYYDGNDQASHNTHTSALKQYYRYIKETKTH